MNRKASAPSLVRVIVLFSMILSASAAAWATTVATPTFSPAAGAYTGTQSVTISDTTSGATIYFTTNGTTPSSSSTKYTAAISVSTSETIEAIAEKSGDTNSSVASAAYTITVSTPTFSPAAGSYTGTQSVTISDATSGATIYYTTNGSTPTSGSTHYTGAISVSTSETVKAIAELSGATNSAVASAAYTITVSTPTISPTGGSYTGTQSVTISDATSGATIYYTTNGTTPTSSSTQYTGAIAVSTSETVEAIAELSGATNSAVASAAYTITVSTPTFSPAAGTYTSAQSVTISDATSGATIYYTTNGSTPTSSSTHYTGAIPVSTSETIKAIAELSGATNSAVASAAYTINLTVATPTFSPPAGSYTGTQSVTISDTTSGATIYYTTNGSTPTSSSTQYTGTISVSTSETVKAIAELSGYTNSTVASAAYTITVSTPTFSPAAGTYTSIQSVTISDAMSGVTIYYTTNGSTPSSSSTQYTNTPITVSTSETIKAIAELSGATNSLVASASYTINLTAATPTFSPGAGTYTSPQSVSIGDTTSGAKIYYTTNGSTPTTSSTRFNINNPIQVSSTETIKAIATATGYAQSAVGSALYTINLTVANPTFSPAAGSYSDALPVTINDSTSGATVYYTTNGTTPTTSSAIYTGAITVSSTETVKALGTESGYAQSAVGSETYTLPAPASTTTTLSVTSGGSPVTSVAQGSVVNLIATVISGGTALSSGVVDFCNATATYCTDINLVGTAQLTSAGTATISLIPGAGSHSYKAVLVGSLSYFTSSSSSVALTVTGLFSTTTTIASSAGGELPLTATVSGLSDLSVAPTGTVSFIDTSNGNAVLGTGSLSGSPQPVAFTNLSTTTFPSTAFIDNNLVATGDFNGDGKMDLAVFSLGSPSVSILLGNGNGAFTLASGSPIAQSYDPSSVAAGDFNGDGKLDLAVVDEYGDLTILLGNGDGTFIAQSSISTVCSGPISLEVADFNRDGKLDLAMPCSQISGEYSYGVIILLGAGNGTFSPATGTPVPFNDGFLSAVVVGDFNGDGIPDLATADGQSEQVSILLGNGDGTFTEATGSPISYGYELDSIAVADFNGDGHLDIAVADWYDARLKILSGNGDGTFTSGTNFIVGNGPYALAVGDYNSDGTPDLAVANEYDGTVTFLLSSGSEPLVEHYATNANAGSQDLEGSWNFNGPFSLAAADFNGDGVSDLVAIIPGTGDSGSQSTIVALDASLTQSATASYSGTPPAGSGGHNVEASYGGDSNYSTSTSSTTPVTTVAPAINLVTPNSGVAGLSVTIEGSNFGPYISGSSGVTFNGLSAQVMTWTPSGIVVFVPAGVTTGPVVVTACDSSVSWCGPTNGVTFSVGTAPQIILVSPVSGSAGTTVTISGYAFGTSGTVTFNGVSATPTSWGNNVGVGGVIIVPVPAGATTGPIVVTTGGVSSVGYNFTVAPGISGIVPTQGVAGTSVTITGAAFGSTQGTSSVLFNGVAAVVSSWSNTSIVATAPNGATTGNVTVVVNSVSGTGPVFTIGPSVSTLTPTSGVAGSLVTISGSGFGFPQGYSSVGFGTVIATPTQWSKNTIVVPVPVAAVTGPVVVYAGGQASNAVQFTVSGSSSGAAGTISGSVTQSNGITPIVGATVNALQGSAVVATTSTLSSGTYSFTNLSAGTYSVQASAFGYGAAQQSGVSVVANQTTTENLALSGQSAINYTYDALGRLTGVTDPVNGAAAYSYDAVGNILSISRASAGQVSILNFTPESGGVSSTVTISGTSFSANPLQDSVSFAGTAATVTSATTSQLVVTVPTGASTGPIGVTAPSGSATSSTPFTVAAGVSGPSITSFAPTMADPGGIVTLTGTGFDVMTNDIVMFNGVPAYVSAASPTSISTTVPTSALSGPISVRTPYGTSTTSANFLVVPAAYGPSQVDFTGQLSVGGAPYTGTLSNGLDIGLLLFNGTEGQELDLHISNSSIASSVITILNPDGSTLVQSAIGAGSSDIDTQPVPTSGIYTILVNGSGGSTGSLTLTLSQISLPSITSGTSQPVTLSSSGQIAQFTFTGTVGQTASVQISSSTFCSQITVLNPNGSTLMSGSNCAGSYLIGPTKLPSSGAYTLIIAGSNGATGSANVLLTVFNNQTGQISSGPTTPVTINIPGQNVQLSFIGIAGQSATALLSSSTFCSGLAILNPDGSTLTSGSNCAGTYSIGPVALPSSGAYTLVIAGSNVATGTASVTLTLQ